MTDYIATRPDLAGNPRLGLHRGSYTVFRTHPQRGTVTDSLGTHDLGEAMEKWADWVDDYTENNLHGRDVRFAVMALAFIDWSRENDRASWANNLARFNSRIAPEVGNKTCGELSDGTFWSAFMGRTIDGTAKTNFSEGGKWSKAALGASSAKVMQDWIFRVYEWGITARRDDGRPWVTSRQRPDAWERLPTPKTKPAKAWSTAQTDAILDGLRQHDWRLYGFLGLGLYTFQRPWLFCKLTRAMVDMDNRMIRFTAIKAEPRHENDRKGVVDVPMHPDLYDILLDVLARTADDGDEALVLGGVASLNAQLKKWLAANDFPGTTYWGKHSSVTNAVRNPNRDERLTLEQVSQMSGVSTKMLKAKYFHATAEDNRHLFEGMRRRSRPALKVVNS